MTTENGLEKVATARRKIETLRRRRDYLVTKIEEREAEGNPRVGWLWQESTALEWALPILEDEWHRLICLRHSLGLPTGNEAVED